MVDMAVGHRTANISPTAPLFGCNDRCDDANATTVMMVVNKVVADSR